MFLEILQNPLSELGWFPEYIGKIVNGFGSVVLGIVIFTLALKLLTFPFDFISRASMRKTQIKMQEMRPELERLQQQYRNNKNLYQQKVMALQKKEGMSMFKSCLPTILTLVIFILVLNGFSTYSNFQNKKDVYDMAIAYNSVVIDAFDIDGELVVKQEKNNQQQIVVDAVKIYNDYYKNGQTTINKDDFSINILNFDSETKTIEISTTNSYFKVEYILDIDQTTGDAISATRGAFVPLEEKLDNSGLKLNGKTYSESKAENAELQPKDFVIEVQRDLAKQEYLNNRQGFLWIKNVWKPDRVDKSPLIDDDNVIKQILNKADYDEITKNVDLEESNGWYILIAINILVTFLSQWAMKKMQKDQLELQSVDGQAMSSQKMMMWMMPLMMAIFSFIYTAAFSVYIILSTLFSILSSFLINKFVDISHNREENKKNQNIVRRG